VFLNGFFLIATRGVRSEVFSVSDFLEDYKKYLGSSSKVVKGIEKYLIEKMVEKNPEAFKAIENLQLDVVVDEDGKTKVITRVKNDE